MTHLFRPADPHHGQPSPSWTAWRGLLYVAAARVLVSLARLCRSQRVRRSAYLVVLLLGLVVQGIILLTVAYLIDLALSLMELWADLARKHLEITLQRVAG